MKNLKQNIRLNPQDSIRAAGFPDGVPQRFVDSIAVLPFENFTGEASAEYLSEGIAESIINSLSRLKSPRVIPRTTEFRYKMIDIDPIEAGRKLGVRVILNGTVRERAGRLKQAVQFDPLSAPMSMVLGHAYNFAGQYDEP